MHAVLLCVAEEYTFLRVELQLQVVQVDVAICQWVQHSYELLCNTDVAQGCSLIASGILPRLDLHRVDLNFVFGVFQVFLRIAL